MMNQAGQSRLDTVLKMLLIAFVSLLAFSSGVYFGKEMSDSDYQLKALESDFTQARKTASTKTEKSSIHDDEALIDEEVESLSDQFVNAERSGSDQEHKETADFEDESMDVAAPQKTAKAAPSKPAPPQNEAPVIKEVAQAKAAPAVKKEIAATDKSVRPDLSAVQKAATRIASNQAPTENAKPQDNRVPSSLPRTIGATGMEYTVQVASYPTLDDAKRHANELMGKGFPAYPVEANIKGKTWYRVSVGSFKTSKEANSYRAQLLKDTELRSAIVQRIQR